MNTLETSHLGGFIIHIPSKEARDAIKKLKEEGIIDITEVKVTDRQDFISYDICGPWGKIRGLMNQGYIDEKTHNFTLNPKKEEKSEKKIFCI